MTRIAFVCVGNAGRSQIATAYAERERAQRDRDRDRDIDIVTGGVDPAGHVHDDVVEALEEDGIDISDRSPRRITPEDVEDATHIVTMGCSADDFTPDGWDGATEQWDLEHPSSNDLEAVRAQRDEIHDRVIELFDRLEV